MPKGNHIKRVPSSEKGALRFIIADPSSKATKSDSLRVVRSHAGRWRWQQVRDRARKYGGEGGREDDCGDSNSLQETGKIRHASLSTCTVGRGAASSSFSSSSASASTAPDEGLYYKGDIFAEDVLQVSPRPNVSFWDSRSTPDEDLSTITSLDEDILDPFQTLPSPVPLNLVSTCNKYCKNMLPSDPWQRLTVLALSVLWPGLMPQPFSDAGHGGVEWFSHSIVHPALHSAMLYGSYSHRRARWMLKGQGDFSADDMKQMVFCECDTIAKINAAIQDPLQAASDAILLSVLCMANNKLDQNLDWKSSSQSPFQAPLRSLQWLDIYGKLSAHPVHQAGLIQLLNLRGGIRAIQLPGLAAIISFSCILGASRSLSRPYLPFVSLQGQHLTLQDLDCSAAAMTSPAQEVLTNIQLTTEMYQVFRGLRSYVLLVERFQDGIDLELGGRVLCDYRNLTQWHIMSLLPASQLGAILLQFCPIYEACRLALMIFGVGVTFPLPHESAPLLSLAGKLQAELQSYGDGNGTESSEVTKVRCWCVVLGGIAATGYRKRQWFL